MSVSTPTQPDFTAQDAATYKAAIDKSAAVSARMGHGFAAYENDTPDMTVKVAKGWLMVDGQPKYVPAQQTVAIEPPTGDYRYDRVVIDQRTGAVEVVAGVDHILGLIPDLPPGKLPVAWIKGYAGMTAITNSDLDDDRLPVPVPVPSPEQIMAEAERQWFDGELGAEGPVALKRVMSFAPSTVTTSSALGVVQTVLKRSDYVGDSLFLGTWDQVDPEVVGTVEGNTGVYSVVCYAENGSNGNQVLYLHPDHGDITTDFTAEAAYTLCVGGEGAGATSGEQTRPEVFVGAGLLADPAKLLAALNAPKDKAPDPLFEHDGEAGGWSSRGGGDISGGILTVPSVATKIGASDDQIFWDNPPLGHYRIRIKVDSITTGSIAIGCRTSVPPYSLGSYVIDAPGDYDLVCNIYEANMVIGVGAKTANDAQVSMMRIIALDETPLQDLAPDPFFEHDGQDGGWTLGGDTPATIAGGQLDFAGAIQWAVCRNTISGGTYPDETPVLTKIVVDSMTIGEIRTYTAPDEGDGGNLGTLISAPGVYYDLLYMDETVTTVGVQNWSTTCDAKVSEFRIYPVTDLPGVLNVGYFDANTWTSQLLADTPVSGDGRVLRLSRATAGTTNATVAEAVRVLSAAGELVPLGAAYPLTELTWAGALANNSVLVDTDDTWATLGYDSEGDMLDAGLFVVDVPHAPRAARPGPVLEAVCEDNRVYYSNSASVAGRVINEAIGQIATGAEVFVDTAAITTERQGSVSNPTGSIKHAAFDMMATGGAAMAWTKKLVSDGSEYLLQIHFVQIVGTGHPGEVPVKDYVTAMTDANGKTVLCGTLHVPTGRPVV